MMEQGLRITALPTLVLVRDGKPVSKMIGADKIMNTDVLQRFALDEQPAEALPAREERFDILERVKQLFPILA